MSILLMILLFSLASFLILLILIQRGRGGGLAGAFGGAGGQSAFGTKAGDMFTRITIGVAAVWILLCAASVKILSAPDNLVSTDLGSSAAPAEDVAPAKTNSATGTKAPAKSATGPAKSSTPDSKSSTPAPTTNTPSTPATPEKP